MERTDVVQSGLSKLLHQFQDKENIVDLVTTYLQQTQDVEDLVFEVLESRGITTAVGRALDQIGAYVGEPRLNRNDSVYRDAIRLRIVINNSNGTPADVIQAAKLLISENITYSEIYPAKIRVEVLDRPPDLTAAARLKSAVLAGVDLEVTYPTIADGITYAAAAINTNIILETNPTGFYS